MAEGWAVTYDEVRLRTDHSDVEPMLVHLDSRFSRRVGLRIPLVSAAMDTVTEHAMAIAMAKLGGLGVIHRGLTPTEQLEHVRRVKYHLSGIITRPITVRDTMTLEQVETMRRERGFSFHSFPVVNEHGRLAGLITQNDFDFCEDVTQSVASIMTRDIITAPAGITVEHAYTTMRQAKKKVLPLVTDDGELVGMYLFSDLQRIMSGSSTTFNLDGEGRLRVAAAVGIGDEALARVSVLADVVDVIVIDTAHGDSANVLETLMAIKRAHDIDVVVGNVSEAHSARRLVNAGADGVKVGQGPGSICTTRVVAGIGCPQVTAIYAVAKELETDDIPICADGGVTASGDLPIAIGAGAHSIMLGRLLAGTREAPGDVEFVAGHPMKHYRGMGSMAALLSSASARERYRESGTARDHLVPEGVEALIPYLGDLETVMVQYVGGLRKGMGYVGATTIEELRRKATFWRNSDVGIRESHPHHVQIATDAPNYWRRDQR